MRGATRPGPVIVMAPRIGIREQLTRYIDKRFFEHAGIDATSLPRKIFELKDGNDDPGDLKDLVITTTVQLLTSLQKKNAPLYQELRNKAVLVLFDEGHYEPAALWSQVVRSLPCARIIFTATAFRDDFKTFDIDSDHAFRYGFDEARRARYIRNVQMHGYVPERSPVAFAAQVIEAYDRIFSAPDEGHADRPRVIVRCDRPEEIRQITAAIGLWFAKNASANISLRRNAFIAVMQAGELRNLDDPSHTQDWPRKWTLLVQAQMGPRSVVISEI